MKISQLAHDVLAAVLSHPDATEQMADDRESLLTAIQNRIDADAAKPKEVRIVRCLTRGHNEFRGPFPDSDKATRWIVAKLESDRGAGQKTDYEIFPLLSPPKR